MSPRLSVPNHRRTHSIHSSSSPPPPSSFAHLHSDLVFDLVIIGAGPAALSVVARILETRPAALYTEEEHLFLHWADKRGQLGRTGSQPLRVVKTRSSGRGSEKIKAGEKTLSSSSSRSTTNDGDNELACECDGEMRILVIDKVGDGWMAHWHRMFKALDIKHLRSPLFFHPSPADLDSLIAYSERKGRNSKAEASHLLPRKYPSAGTNCAAGCHEEARGRDRRVKRLGCCAGLDDGDHGVGRDSHNDCPDLVEIPGVVGTDVSKHKKKKCRQSRGGSGNLIGSTGGAINERERRDYYTPSTALFRDFVDEDVIQRYGLCKGGGWPTAKAALDCKDSGAKVLSPVQTVKGEVTSMEWSELLLEDSTKDQTMAGFLLHTSDGVQIGAKAVVSAVGPAGKPSIPAPLQSSSYKDKPLQGPGWCHSAALATAAQSFPQAPSHCPSAPLVVIGGGLTSAQICDVALRHGHFDKAVLILRGHLKVKAFDVGLDWMGRYSNLRKMQFWQEDDPAERLTMFKDARGGGSMTLPYARLLKRYEEQGRLKIYTHTELETASWEDEKWQLGLRRQAAGETNSSKRRAKAAMPVVEESDSCDCSTSASATSSLEHIDAGYIITASAFTPDFQSLPMMKDLAARHPIEQHGGLPLVTEDLQYGSLPLFVVGMYSALQIGPAAGNLGGIREAADRVVSRLQQLIQPPVVTSSSPTFPTASPTADEAADARQDEETLLDGVANGGDNLDQSNDSSEEVLPPSSFTHFGFEALALEG